MKKVLAILLALIMVLSLAACGNKEEGEEKQEDTFKVGMICIGNKEKAYDRNFMNAADKATEILKDKGINVEWLYSIDHPVDTEQVTTDNLELAEEGCKVVFNNSYGQEAFMLKAAEEAPDTVFVGLTSDQSYADDKDNTANAFAEIYNGRYLGGVIAGMKLNELIKEGKITEDEAVIGYVGAFPFAEVRSGYTAFYLGARSVCPSAVMYVNFINSWGDLEAERTAANALIEKYHAVVISQHSDNISPAEAAENAGVYHVGYNLNMIPYAENASLCSPRIDWTNYFVYVIETVYNGGKIDQDYVGSLKNGEVVIDEFNESLVSEDAIKAYEDAKAKLISGELSVFDTANFTVDGKTLPADYEIGIDQNGDFAPDVNYKPINDKGVYQESTFRSAPYFAEVIDGITEVQ